MILKCSKVTSTQIALIAGIFSAYSPTVQGKDLSGLGQGAQLIVQKALQDMSSVRSACRGGRKGVTELVTNLAIELVLSGESINPADDGPEAGGYLGSKCREYLSSN